MPTNELYMCITSNQNDQECLSKFHSIYQKIKDKQIGASNLKDLFRWVDVHYAVHASMYSHTRGNMSLV